MISHPDRVIVEAFRQRDGAAAHLRVGHDGDEAEFQLRGEWKCHGGSPVLASIAYFLVANAPYSYLPPFGMHQGRLWRAPYKSAAFFPVCTLCPIQERERPMNHSNPLGIIIPCIELIARNIQISV